MLCIVSPAFNNSYRFGQDDSLLIGEADESILLYAGNTFGDNDFYQFDTVGELSGEVFHWKNSDNISFSESLKSFEGALF